MIQFNLLPDIKMQYVRAKRNKRLVMLVAIIASVASLALFIVMFFSVHVVQNTHISNLTEDINAKNDELKSIENLDKILTIQNQLQNLTALHDKKPVAERLYGYLRQLVPVDVTISKLNVDFETSIISFEGASNPFSTVNQFIDTLKFANFATGEQSNEVAAEQFAFQDVVLDRFSVEDESASYSISAKFDPAIFSSDSNVRLIIRNQITTRSETEKPLFKEQEIPQDAVIPSGGSN